MKTWTAILSHIGIAAVQVGAAFASAPQIAHLPWWAQILVQVGGVAAHGVVATANSNSDQNGNTLPPPTK